MGDFNASALVINTFNSDPPGGAATLKQTLPSNSILSDFLIGPPAQIPANDAEAQQIWIRSRNTFCLRSRLRRKTVNLDYLQQLNKLFSSFVVHKLSHWVKPAGTVQHGKSKQSFLTWYFNVGPVHVRKLHPANTKMRNVKLRFSYCCYYS